MTVGAAAVVVTVAVGCEAGGFAVAVGVAVVPTPGGGLEVGNALSAIAVALSATRALLADGATGVDVASGATTAEGRVEGSA